MTEKTKKTLVITISCVLCAMVAAGIGTRFAGRAEVPPATLEDVPAESNEPTVKFDTTKVGDEQLTVNIDQNVPTAKSGAGADSTGTEQTIQADPVKPDPPAPPQPSDPVVHGDEEHSDDDVPAEDRNTEAPPTYTPEQTHVTPPPVQQGTYDGTGGYVPGFGYIQSSGAGCGTVADTIYENGNKVGIMD